MRYKRRLRLKSEFVSLYVMRYLKLGNIAVFLLSSLYMRMVYGI